MTLTANLFKGFVTSTWRSGDGGPAKRQYALTVNGRTCLARWTTTLRAYRDAVGNLLDTAASSRPAKNRRPRNR